MPLMLSRVYDKHFTDPSTSDFKIICGSKIFYVHKVVLREYEYFKRMLSGPWTEAQSNQVELKDDDPYMVLHMLSNMYGLPYWATEREIAHDVAKLQGYDVGMAQGAFKPSIEWKEQWEDFDDRGDGYKLNKCAYEDIPLCASKYHCKVLRCHAELYALASKYGIGDLLRDSRHGFIRLQYDCWETQEILSIVEFVYSSTVDTFDISEVREHDEQNYLDLSDYYANFRTCMAEMMGRKFHALRKNSAFKTLLKRFPEMGMAILEVLAKIGLPHESDAGRYCPTYCCRRDTPGVLHSGMGEWYCPTCNRKTKTFGGDPCFSDYPNSTGWIDFSNGQNETDPDVAKMREYVEDTNHTSIGVLENSE